MKESASATTFSSPAGFNTSVSAAASGTSPSAFNGSFAAGSGSGGRSLLGFSARGTSVITTSWSVMVVGEWRKLKKGFRVDRERRRNGNGGGNGGDRGSERRRFKGAGSDRLVQ